LSRNIDLDDGLESAQRWSRLTLETNLLAPSAVTIIERYYYSNWAKGQQKSNRVLSWTDRLGFGGVT